MPFHSAHFAYSAHSTRQNETRLTDAQRHTEAVAMKAMRAMKGGAFNAFNALNLVHRSQGRGLVQHARSAFSRPTSLELPIAPIALPMMLFNVFQGFSHPHGIGESENPASLNAHVIAT